MSRIYAEPHENVLSPTKQEPLFALPAFLR